MLPTHSPLNLHAIEWKLPTDYPLAERESSSQVAASRDTAAIAACIRAHTDNSDPTRLVVDLAMGGRWSHFYAPWAIPLVILHKT